MQHLIEDIQLDLSIFVFVCLISLAVPGLCCDTGSLILVAACELSVAECGILVPWPGMKP